MSLSSSLPSSDNKAWNAFLDFCAKFPPKGWEWLLTPKAHVFWFALRTAAAACLALGIAFWMELDNPAWSALTVGAVAQISRGETLSKARFRVVGTLIGCTAALTFTALAPQHPWIFFPLIAFWVGGCVFFGTLNNNYRTYACVLAGYTCAIVSFGAAPNGDQVFDLTMARGTYILLGIGCEALLSCIFSANVSKEAKKKLQSSLTGLMSSATITLKAVLNRDTKLPLLVRQELSTILSFDNQVEFLAVEIGSYNHRADHARAALNSMSILLSRAFALAMRLKATATEYSQFNKMANLVLEFLNEFATQLTKTTNFSVALTKIHTLRETCRQNTLPVTDKGTITETRRDINERVLFVFLGELLRDLERVVWQLQASLTDTYGDTFRFSRHRYKDIKLAYNNGVRSFCAIMVSALWFEITAWDEGYVLLSFTAMSAGLFGPTDNPILGSFNFFKGAFAGWISAFFLVLIWMPSVTIFEPLVVIFGGVFFIGGLAKGNPKLAAAASAFSLLLSAMLGFQNHHVMTENAFWNNNLAIVSSALVSVGVFRIVFPYNPMEECRRIRRALLTEIHNLANLRKQASIQRWASHASERAMILHKRAAQKEVPYVQAYLKGTLATLALGLNIVRLRRLLERDYLPQAARRPILLVLGRIEDMFFSTKEVKHATEEAINHLSILDESNLSVSEHLEITKALTYLIVIQQSLKGEDGFLTDRILSSPDRPIDASLLEHYI